MFHTQSLLARVGHVVQAGLPRPQAGNIRVWWDMAVRIVLRTIGKRSGDL